MIDEAAMTVARHAFTEPFWQRLLLRGIAGLPTWFTRPAAVFLSSLFLLLLPRQRRAIRDNLDIAVGRRRGLAGLWHTWKVFVAWGQILIDAFRVHVGQPFPLLVNVEGGPYLDRAKAAGRGAVLVTCHIGSWHVAGRILEDFGFGVNILMQADPDPRNRRLFESMAGDRAIRFLHVDQDWTSPLRALQALRQNELVAIQADRPASGSKIVEVPFFNRPFRFPLGPSLLAWLSGAPIIPAVTVRVGVDHYRVICDGMILPNRQAENRDQEIERLTRETARHLEALIVRYPHQWFNFVPIWA